LQDRTTASVWLPYWKRSGCEVIDGGVSATLDRLAVARLLAESGLPRPETTLVISEASGLSAIEGFKGVGTLLPLAPGSRELALADREIAEAVLEHRDVLGDGPQSISLMQQGLARDGNRLDVVVVGGRAIAVCGAMSGDLQSALALSEAASQLLGARLLGVTLTEIDGRIVIWDINPVPEFRDCQPIGETTVEVAVADLVMTLSEVVRSGQIHLAGLIRGEVADNVVLSA
jgi:hypothetical protein